MASSPPEEAEADNALATDPNFVHVDLMRHWLRQKLPVHEANMEAARLQTANNQLQDQLVQVSQELQEWQSRCYRLETQQRQRK